MSTFSLKKIEISHLHICLTVVVVLFNIFTLSQNYTFTTEMNIVSLLFSHSWNWIRLSNSKLTWQKYLGRTAVNSWCHERGDREDAKRYELFLRQWWWYRWWWWWLGQWWFRLTHRWASNCLLIYFNFPYPFCQPKTELYL